MGRAGVCLGRQGIHGPKALRMVYVIGAWMTTSVFKGGSVQIKSGHRARTTCRI